MTARADERFGDFAQRVAQQEISEQIHKLCGPYLRLEPTPDRPGWVRFWFGPHCWVDVDQATFDRFKNEAADTPEGLER